jgi:hypothetical protein
VARKRAKKRSRRGGRGYTWLLSLTDKHVEELRRRLAEKGPLWSEWEYKVHGGNILIYTPVTPWDAQTGKPDPSRRYMSKHLRIVPSQPGPFGLQYWRHTEQWSSLPCAGSIGEIADFIEEDPFRLCAPAEPPPALTRQHKPETSRGAPSRSQEPYDSSWDRDDEDAFDRKCEEWDRRDWIPWLTANLTFPFRAERVEHMYLDPGAPEELYARDPFPVGCQVQILGIPEGDFEPDFDGVIVRVQGAKRKGYVPLQDFEVRPKRDPNYWPVREFVVWYANR